MKNSSSSRAWFAILLFVGIKANVALSQFVLSPVTVIGTNVTTFSDTASVTNLINQSGIETPFVSGVTVFDTYFANPGQMFATSGNGGTNNWSSDTAYDPGYQGYLDFDLGAVYEINKIAIWSHTLSNITVKILSDLNGPEQVAGDFTLSDKQSFSSSYAVEVFPFAATYQGRYVRLVINSIYLFQGYGFGNAIVGEVVVSASPVGPASPAVGVTHNPNGDVLVTFSGTLETSATIGGTFTNVPGNPSSPFTLPKASLLPKQYFRARGN